MGFLGFDSIRLGTLAEAIDRADRELADAQVAYDPVTAAAFNEIASAKRNLIEWGQRIRSLLINPAITTAPPSSIRPFNLDRNPLPATVVGEPQAPTPRYGRGEIAADDLGHALLYERQQVGWTIAIDPTAEVALTPQEQSMDDAALASRLRSEGVARTLPGKNGEVVRAKLADIAQDTRRSREFLAVLGDEGLARLADEYAKRWFNADTMSPGVNGQRNQAADDVATLAKLIDCGRASRSAPLPAAFTDSMDPLAAALVLADLNVDAATLGSYSAAVLQRWFNDPPHGHGPWFVSTADPAVGPGGILFERMAKVPGASATFVGSAMAMDDAVRLQVLYGSVYDEADYRFVLEQSTNPAYVTSDQARLILMTVTEDCQRLSSSVFLRTDHRSDHAMLGTMAAPWLMQLTNIDHAWGLSSPDGARLMNYIFQDGASRQALLDSADQIAAGVYNAAGSYDNPDRPQDWEAFMQRVHDIETLQGMLAGSSLLRGLSDQQRADYSKTFWLNAIGSVAELGVSAATEGALEVPAQFVIGQATNLIGTQIASDGPIATIARSGVSSDEARNTDVYQAMTSMYAVAAGANTQGSGRSRAGTPPPAPATAGDCSAKDYDTDLDAWIAATPGAELRDRLRQAKGLILNPYSNGFDCSIASGT